MKISILGSSGKIYDEFFSACATHDNQISIYGRKCFEEKFFDIHEKSTWPVAFDADLIILLAWDLNQRKNIHNNLNAEFAFHVLRVAEEQKCHVIFVSSVSAHPNSLSVYGKTKFQVETEYLARGMTILKVAYLVTTKPGVSTDLSQKILSIMRTLPFKYKIVGLGPIPFISAPYLRKELHRIIGEFSPGRHFLIEHKADPEIFFSSKAKIFTVLRVPVSFVNYIFICGKKSKLMPANLVDRWFSLYDSTFSQQ